VYIATFPLAWLKGEHAMKKYRITYESDNGTIYSYIDQYFDDGLKVGEWKYPFPNEKGDSTAFGLVECFEQGDHIPYEFGKIIRVEVEEVSC
jgi:hypothetical protein